MSKAKSVETCVVNEDQYPGHGVTLNDMLSVFDVKEKRSRLGRVIAVEHGRITLELES